MIHGTNHANPAVHIVYSCNSVIPESVPDYNREAHTLTLGFKNKKIFHNWFASKMWRASIKKNSVSTGCC